MDIARDICTDSFYIVNSGLPCIAVTAVLQDQHQHGHHYQSWHYQHLTIAISITSSYSRRICEFPQPSALPVTQLILRCIIALHHCIVLYCISVLYKCIVSLHCIVLLHCNVMYNVVVSLRCIIAFHYCIVWLHCIIAVYHCFELYCNSYCNPVICPRLGKPPPTKTDEFSEKFQTAFDPPPLFLENHVADFL